jgi:osmotically inducible lipoprotein OsmB
MFRQSSATRFDSTPIRLEDPTMLTSTAFSFRGLAMALALTAGVIAAGDASALSRKDKNTLVGAVVGGVAGHVLSNGDPMMTAGGAVAGGAIGNVTTKDRRDNRDYRHDRDRRYDRDHRYERTGSEQSGGRLLGDG